jgi:aspartate/glutamate racemase
MKTIGILGGMSAVSTQLYYAKLCDLVRDALGGLHSPELLIQGRHIAEFLGPTTQRAARTPVRTRALSSQSTRRRW